MSRFLLWLVLAVFLAPNAGMAQTPLPLIEGERVRIAYRCQGEADKPAGCQESGRARIATGRLRALDGNSLRILAEPHQEELVIPTASLADLSVMRGTRGHSLAGAAIGVIAGALFGGVVGSTQEFCVLSCVAATGIGIALGAPAGLLLGAVAGAVIRSDRWRSVSIKDHRIQVEPRLAGIGLTVSVAF